MEHEKVLRDVLSNTNDYAKDLKRQSGKKIIGYVCSYTPEEIIMAAGAHPMRLLGSKENIHLADAHLQSYCCSLVRGILEEALSGRTGYLDGMVFPHTCDSIQRLSDIWRMNIDFGFHLDVVLPVKMDTDSAREYLYAVIAKFKRDLEKAMGIEISEEALRRSISITNTIRRHLKEIYGLRCQNPAIMKGESLFTLIRSAMIMEREQIANILSDVIGELRAKAAGSQAEKVKRVVLAGGICNHPDIYPMIEDAGGAIVWDDFCTGYRYFSELIDETKAPLEGIAEKFMNRVVCPAKHLELDSRANHLVRMAKEAKAEGVIFLLLKFCDPHAFDYPYLKKALEDADIPVMLLEIDDPLPAVGQLRTRLEAFIEML